MSRSRLSDAARAYGALIALTGERAGAIAEVQGDAARLSAQLAIPQIKIEQTFAELKEKRVSYDAGDGRILFSLDALVFGEPGDLDLFGPSRGGNPGNAWTSRDGKLFVTRDHMVTLRSAYPMVEIVAELNKMEAWIDAKKRRFHSRDGWKRFVNSWLSRSADRTGPAKQGKRLRAEYAALADIVEAHR